MAVQQQTKEEALPEPWLRGPLSGVHPLVMPVFFSFALVREDLRKHMANLPPQAVWRSFEGATLGFHLKHLAGSVDRLTTYLAGSELTAAQLEALDREHDGVGSLADLLAALEAALQKSEAELQQLNPASLYDARAVGRRRLPTTVLGLIVHLAEHTQRHLGQTVLLAKLLK